MIERRYDRVAIVLGIAWALFWLLTALGPGIDWDAFLGLTLVGWAVLAIWPAIRWIKGGK